MATGQEQFENLLRERVQREKRSSRVSAILMLVSFVVGGGWIWYSYLEVKAQQAEKQRLEAEKAGLDSAITAKRQELKEMEKNLAEKTQQLNEIAPIALKSFGWSSDSLKSAGVEAARVEQSLKAQVLRSQLAKTDVHQHASITVRYYPKDVDRGVVERAIRDLGFRLDVRQVQVPDLPTNAIWYGAGVERNDVRLVALTLIRAGVQIRSIRPFSEPAGQKKYFIEIGADRAVVGHPVWTVERLSAPEKF